MAEKFSFSNFFGINDDKDLNNSADYQPNNNHHASNVTNKPKAPKIVNMQRDNVDNRVSIFEPRIYSDAKVMASKLMDGDAVIVNLAHAKEDSIRRIVDFLTGCVYTIDGDIKRVDDKVFLCTPHGFDVSGGLEPHLRKTLK